MTATKIYVQTGERFAREDDGSFAASVGSALTSGESSNKVYQFAVSPNDIPDFMARKPLDAGSMKILSNNISHLLYQKCRTLCCVNGPGLFGLLKPLGLTSQAFSGDTGATGAEQYREINWSRQNSLRLGPFSAMIDRQTQDRPSEESTLPANVSCLRKMVLVINGYKRSGFEQRFHVCVSINANAHPINSRTALLNIDASQLAWIEFVSGTSSGTGITLPSSPYSSAVAYRRQAWEAHTTELLTAYDGDYKLFIPVDVVTAPEQPNWQPTDNSEIYKIWVWLGWYSADEDAGIRSITLLESRDIGTAEAS